MFRLLLLTTAVCAVWFSISTVTTEMVLRSLDFEVFGRVQGVFFRKLKGILKTGCGKSITLRQNSRRMLALDFEVFGIVQGVNFRMYTKEQAEKLGLRGWCKNTAQGTVLGHMQGPSDKVESMMHWLKTSGSPSSQIDKAEFRNQKDINEYSFDSFIIKKD